jgi:hypothetical protein
MPIVVEINEPYTPPTIEPIDTPVVITGGSLTINSQIRLLERQLPDGTWEYAHPQPHKATQVVDVFSHNGTWQRRLSGLRFPRVVVHYE